MEESPRYWSLKSITRNLVFFRKVEGAHRLIERVLRFFGAMTMRGNSPWDAWIINKRSLCSVGLEGRHRAGTLHVDHDHGISAMPKAPAPPP
jgi:hypothetical protein